MDFVTLAIDLGIGYGIGLVGGLFGVGGGIVAIPVLAVAFGLSEHVAQGTALVAIVPNVVSGLWNYARRDRLDVRIASLLAITGAIFTTIAAIFATRANDSILRHAFAVFLVFVAGWTILRLTRGIGVRREPLPWPWTGIVGAFGGALSGFFGIGGATIAPPMLTALFAMQQTTAQGLALALVAPGSIVALATYANAGDVAWPIGIPLALGGLVAVPSGVALAHRLPTRRLGLLFAGLVAVTAVMMLFDVAS